MNTYADYYNATMARKPKDEDVDMNGDSVAGLGYPEESIEEETGNTSVIPRNLDLSRSLAIELESSSSSHPHPQSHMAEHTIILTIDTNVRLLFL